MVYLTNYQLIPLERAAEVIRALFLKVMSYGIVGTVVKNFSKILKSGDIPMMEVVNITSICTKVN